MYRQPDDVVNNHRSQEPQFHEALSEFLNNLPSNDGVVPDVIFGGDFNLPHVNWSTGGMKSGASKDERSMVDELHRLMDELCLFQFVKDGNTLDLVFTNNKSLIHSLQCIPTANTVSHHCLVETRSLYKGNDEVVREEKVPLNDFQKFNYFNDLVDWEVVNSALQSKNWNEIFSGLDHCDKWKKLLEVCLEVTELHVPKRTPFNPSLSNIPRDRKILLRRRRKIKKLLPRKNNSQVRIGRLRNELLKIQLKLQLL